MYGRKPHELRNEVVVELTADLVSENRTVLEGAPLPVDRNSGRWSETGSR
jgi:hypothetical protein